MTLKNLGRKTLAAIAGTGAVLLMASCGVSNTIDYLYVASSKNNPGQINVYKVDSLSGALTQIPNSPYLSLGRNPVGLVTSPNGKNLYVINHDDNTLVEFGIGTDAKLYPGAQYTTPGSEPVALAINKQGTLLFVVDNFQPGYTDLIPGPGALVVYPIKSPDGTLGTPVAQTVGNMQTAYYPLDTAPTAVNALANGSAVYVTEQLNSAESTACNGGSGGVVTLAVGSGGAVAPVLGSPFCAGTTPSSVVSDPTNRFVYVTDSSQNQLIGYNILSGTNASTPNALQPFVGGPIAAGTSPSNVTIDPRGLYLYLTNFYGNSLQGYAINTTTGIPSASTPSSYVVGAHPQCVIVEPALGRFAYVTAFADNNVYGYKLNPNNGALTGTQNSPYPTSGQPTCAAAVVHGNHPTITAPSSGSPVN